MIRNQIDGQDVPMMQEHEPACATVKPWSDPTGLATAVIDFCTCRPPFPKLVVDVHQQRLEHRQCPDCPNRLRGDFGPIGWWVCRCCGRAWRRRTDGYYDEQIPLGTFECAHVGDPLAGPA